MFVRTCVCVCECVPARAWEREKAPHKRKDQIFRIFLFFVFFYLVRVYHLLFYRRLAAGSGGKGGAELPCLIGT